MRILLLSVLLLISFPLFAQLPFYLGIDGQYCRLDFQKGYGDSLFSNTTPGINPIIGAKINDSFAIEAGYHFSHSSKTTTLQSGPIVGNPNLLAFVSAVTFVSKTTFKEPHLKFLVFTPKLANQPVQFFAGIGITNTRARFKFKAVQAGIFPVNRERTVEKCRSLQTLTIGALYNLNDTLSMRGTIVFKNTARLGGFANDGFQSALYGIPEIKPKNSINYGLGIFYTY